MKRSLAGPASEYLSFLDGFQMSSQDRVLRYETGSKDPRVFYRELEQDDRVFAVLQKRYTNVLNGDVVIEPGKRRGMSSTRADKKAADMVNEQIKNMGNTRVGNVENNAAKAYFPSAFTNFTMGMLDAIHMGYAVGEVMWEIDGDEVVASEVIPREQDRFLFVKNGDEYHLHLQDSMSMAHSRPLPARKFIVYTWGSNNDPYGLGLGNRLYWPVFFKRRGMSFWLKFLEKHGIPTVVGKTTSADDQERKKLLDAAKALQSDSAVVIDEGDMLDLLEVTRGAIQTGGYEQMNAQMNKAITITVLGSELSTDINEGGSRAATTVHSQEEKNLAIKDGRELAGGPYSRLVQWIVYHNFTDDVAMPIIQRRYPLQENLEEEARIMKTLSEMGFEATTESGLVFVNEKFGKGSEDPIFEYTGKKESSGGQDEEDRDREGEKNFQDEQDGTDQDE